MKLPVTPIHISKIQISFVINDGDAFPNNDADYLSDEYIVHVAIDQIKFLRLNKHCYIFCWYYFLRLSEYIDVQNNGY